VDASDAAAGAAVSAALAAISVNNAHEGDGGEWRRRMKRREREMATQEKLRIKRAIATKKDNSVMTSLREDQQQPYARAHTHMHTTLNPVSACTCAITQLRPHAHISIYYSQ
jgi:hypothetical protein